METDAIKAFVEYAKAHGSGKAEMYYIHFSRLANEAVGIKDRDQADVGALLNLRVVEQMIDKAILLELQAGTEYHQIFGNVRDRVRQVTVLAFTPKLLADRAS